MTKEKREQINKPRTRENAAQARGSSMGPRMWQARLGQASGSLLSAWPVRNHQQVSPFRSPTWPPGYLHGPFL